MTSRPLTLPWQAMPSRLAGPPGLPGSVRSPRTARSRIRAPTTPAARAMTPPVTLKAGTGGKTVPAGVVADLPLIPPLTPVSSTPVGTFSGPLVNQSPGPSSTLPPAPTSASAVLTAAVSAAPVWSPDGLSVAVDGIPGIEPHARAPRAGFGPARGDFTGFTGSAR